MAETAVKAAKAVKVPKISPGANTLREYELIYLLKQDLTTEQTDRIKERVRGIVDREGGKVLKFTTWGKKKTAFLVGDKQARAIYVHLSFLGGGRAVSEVERNLRNLEEVIKYQTLKISDAVLPESRPTEEDVVLEGDREDERPAREEGREGRDDRGGREGRDDRGSREGREGAPAAAAAPAADDESADESDEASATDGSENAE